MPRKGAILSTSTDSYTIEKTIGAGGAGEVYSVVNEVGERLAAKVLRRGIERQKLRRFRAELTFCMSANHPNIITVLDHGVSAEAESFYIMPLAERTFRSLMKAGIEEGKRLPLFGQMLDGVEAAHMKGVVHRDLKPENVLIFSETPGLKIADFGIAQFEESDLLKPVETMPGERLANFEYAAPEQKRPGGVVDARADIFALGLILAELFTGQVPHGAGPTTVAAKSPNFAYLDNLIESMIQQDPDRRPKSIADIKNQLSARGNEFIEKQKLDALRRTVIRDSEITDPLISDPPTITNINYTGDTLVFELSTSLPEKWAETFHQMIAGGLNGYGPSRHKIWGRSVSIPAQEYLLTRLVAQFKGYLTTANERYALRVRNEETQRIAAERASLKSQIARKEELERINKTLTW